MLTFRNAGNAAFSYIISKSNHRLLSAFELNAAKGKGDADLNDYRCRCKAGLFPREIDRR